MVFTYFKQTGINLRYGDDNEVYDSEDEGYDFSNMKLKIVLLQTSCL